MADPRPVQRPRNPDEQRRYHREKAEKFIQMSLDARDQNDAVKLGLAANVHATLATSTQTIKETR